MEEHDNFLIQLLIEAFHRGIRLGRESNQRREEEER